MTDQNEVVTLGTLRGGAAMQLWQVEWERILADVKDLNTEAEDVREVTLVVKVKPNADRDVGSVEIVAKSKLGHSKGAHTVIYIGKDRGSLVAVENDPKQMQIFQPEAPAKFPAAAGEKE